MQCNAITVPCISPHIKQLMRKRDFHKNRQLNMIRTPSERNKVNIQNIYDTSSGDQMPKAGVDRCPDIRFKFPNINVSNVAIGLSNLKASKATGMDNIPAKTYYHFQHVS